MKQRNRTVLIVLLLVIFSIVALSVNLTSAQSNQRVSYNKATGKVSFIGASVASPLIVPGAVAEGLSTDARAGAILAAYAPQFGVAAQDLVFTRGLTTRDGRISNRYQQVYQGLPVLGAEIIVNMTKGGGLVSMIGKASPDLAVGTAAAVTAAQAQQTAVQRAAKTFRVSASTLAASSASLAIFDERLLNGTGRGAQLVYQVEVTSTVGAPIKAAVLVNAATGNVSLIYNTIDATGWSKGNPYNVNAGGAVALPQVSSRVPGTADLSTHDTNNSETLPGTFLCDETDLTCTDAADTDADAAHAGADDVYNMYFDWHNRDSLDDAGFQLISTVHFAAGYCNAFWNSTQMAYGDGCPSTIVVDDVIGHELTHGVTEFTSNLVYAFQSGAMNESFSDVWGEFYDITNGTPEDTAENRWRIGEELDFGDPGGGIRDMADPTLFGHPDRMQSPLYYLGAGDNGGVHLNSGVNNKAAYLLVDGDTFNGQTVTGLGVDKTVQIYYDTQTTKLSTNSQYADLYDALQQSCTELIGSFGITAEDCQEVTDAVTATEMNLEPGAPAATADVCETGAPVFAFQDDLESGVTNWTVGTFATGPQAWELGDTDAPLVGTASNFGADLAEVSGSFAALANGVVIPADAYLHFDHHFGFEFDGAGFYDGGIVEYSTDGGTTWVQLLSAANEEGLDYGGVLDNTFSNPLGGKNAFVAGSGGGVGSSRYTLAALSGSTALFRWSIGSDSLFGAEGWQVDNVKIYTCEGETPSDNLVSNGDFESDLTDWTVKNAVGDKVKCNKEDKVVANTGLCAFQFKGGVGENSKLQQNLDIASLTFVAGETLDLSAFVNGKPSATGGKVKVSVAYSDSTEATKLKASLPATGAYIELTGSVDVASAAVQKVKLMFSNKSTAGKIFVDTVEVVQTAAAALPLPLPAAASSLTGK